MPETLATQPGQTAAPDRPGTANPANGTSGQETVAAPAQTSPGTSPAPTSAPAPPSTVKLKVYGNEIPWDLSNPETVNLLQKGMAYDTREQKIQEQVNARAEQLLQERAAKQADDNRMAQLRESDPLAASVEERWRADAQKAQAIENEVRQTREELNELKWSQQVAEVKRQYSDLTDRDMNRAYAEVFVSKGQTSLQEAVKLVKEEKDAFEQRVIADYLQKLKTNANTAPPAVPSGGGGVPVFQGDANAKLDFSDKNAMRTAVQEYVKKYQGGS